MEGVHTGTPGEGVKHCGGGQTDQIKVTVLLPPGCSILYTLTTVNFSLSIFKMGIVLALQSAAFLKTFEHYAEY